MEGCSCGDEDWIFVENMGKCSKSWLLMSVTLPPYL